MLRAQLALIRGAAALRSREANAADFASMITGNFTVSGVFAQAGPVVGALAVLVIGLSVGPRYGLKVLRWIKGAIG